MKLLANKSALFFPSLLIALCLCCTEKDKETAHTTDKPMVVETKEAHTAEKPEVVEKKQEETNPNVVAKIGDYTITKEELKNRIIKELLPNPYDLRSNFEMPDTEAVLLKMIAEKAIVMEARKQNLNEDEITRSVIKQFKEKKFVNALLAAYLQGKITVTDSEIDEQIKSNPKLDRANAKTMLIRTKSGNLLNQYYNELYTKFNVQKLSENFFKTAQIHNRLLYQPKKTRKMNFIRISQTKEELTPEEKEIVLATYDYGKITLKDWFAALCEMSPPSRPKDLHTPKGVEQLLDRALKMPIFVSEAKLLGFDKDEDILKQAKDYEDSMLLTKAKREKIKDIKGPIDEEQIVAYFNKNKELFGTQNTLNIDQIWCQDLKTAQKAKAELDGGKGFESVKKSYSLEKKSKPYNTYPGSEGFFFNDLWKGEPNEVIGPVKGFYAEGVKWRIVKILEKKPGIVKEYSPDMNKNIEMKMLERQRSTTLEEYTKELLEEYSYEIYADRIRGINPLDIP
jgi:peptidyl-prolyl cis-trans isomerase C